MACTSCISCITRVLQKNTTHGDFHQYKELKSPDPACVICTRLREDLKGHDEIKDSTITHRWTIRQSTKIRETARVTTVILRAKPGVVFSQPDKHGNTYPPTRIFYLIPEKDYVQGVLSPEKLGKSTGSNAALSQIVTWFKECENENIHPECALDRRQKQKETEAAMRNKRVPKRLIDVGRETHDVVQLVETGPNVFGRYITLSYCWGDKPHFCLLPDNEAELMKEIAWLEMPATFKDVVKIARRLKIKYVWIDALCIMQDNKEFLIEGQYMHQVYRNSTLTLAAAASKDSRGGLFHERSPADVVSLPITIPKSKILEDEKWRVFSGDLWEQQLLQERLYQRGWVFQERYLSPRLVHFASKQLFWDCPKLSACETFPRGLPKPLDIHAAIERHWRERLQYPARLPPNQQLVGTADDSPEELWRTAVHSYTNCALTDSNDKLLAIWGVAKLVRDMLNEEYAAGLWQHSLHEQLAWRVDDCTATERMKAVYNKVVPSWSWASIKALKKFGAARISLPERLNSGRYKVAMDHNEKLLAFTLAKESPDSQKPRGDLEPELAEIGLAMRAHIFQISLRQEADNWALRMVDAAESLGKLEIFPDTKPKMIKKADDDETGQEYGFWDNSVQNMPKQDNYATVIASSRVLRPGHDKAAEILEYHGFGLIMQYAGSTGRPTFRRTGMFRFHGLTQSEFELFERPHARSSDIVGSDMNKEGIKFWLE